MSQAEDPMRAYNPDQDFWRQFGVRDVEVAVTGAGYVQELLEENDALLREVAVLQQENMRMRKELSTARTHWRSAAVRATSVPKSTAQA